MTDDCGIGDNDGLCDVAEEGIRVGEIIVDT